MPLLCPNRAPPYVSFAIRINPREGLAWASQAPYNLAASSPLNLTFYCCFLYPPSYIMPSYAGLPQVWSLHRENQDSLLAVAGSTKLVPQLHSPVSMCPSLPPLLVVSIIPVPSIPSSSLPAHSQQQPNINYSSASLPSPFHCSCQLFMVPQPSCGLSPHLTHTSPLNTLLRSLVCLSLLYIWPPPCLHCGAEWGWGKAHHYVDGLTINSWSLTPVMPQRCLPTWLYFSSLVLSHSVVSDSLRPHGL